MWELILTDLGKIVGFEFVVFMLILFSFIVMVISRGLGVTAIIGTILLTSYLLSENLIDGRQFLSSEWFVAIVIIVGMLIGYMVYSLFLSR